MASARTAYRDGWRRVASAPGVVIGVFALLLIVSAPATLSVRTALAQAFGDSTIAGRFLAGFDLQAWREMAADHLALDEFGPWVLGFAATLKNANDLVGLDPGSGSALLIAIWFVLGTAVSGGLIDRYARQRPLRAHGFIAASGRTVFRLLRLNLMVLALYAAVLAAGRSVARPALAALTRDVTAERTAILWAWVAVSIGLVLVSALTIVADCARVRLVVEDRRSALFALAAGWRFARRHARTLVALYLLLAGTLGLWLAAYFVVTTAVGSPSSWTWLAFAAGQVYVAGRVAIKLLTYAAVTAAFQSELAHAGYIAAPAPVWPESPLVETLGPLGQD